MKKIAFITRRKMLAQGLESAVSERYSDELSLLPLIPPQNVLTDATVYEPDIIIIDVTFKMLDTMEFLCIELRKIVKNARIIMLSAEDDAVYRDLSVQLKIKGLIDDFVFYDNSMNYIIAKLAAL